MMLSVALETKMHLAIVLLVPDPPFSQHQKEFSTWYIKSFEWWIFIAQMSIGVWSNAGKSLKQIAAVDKSEFTFDVVTNKLDAHYSSSSL